MSEPLALKGVNGTIAFDGSTLTIQRKGLMNKGSKMVPLASIGGVQIKAPTALLNGFIQFSIAGEIARSAGGVGRLQDAANDENAIIITKKQLPAAEELRATVLDALSAPSAANAQPDLADQLAKLAALRDSGILTEEEFATKKADLLARL